MDRDKHLNLFSGILVSILLFLCLPVSSGLGADDDISFAPPNPAFVEYINTAKAKPEAVQAQDVRATGFCLVF